MLRFRNDHEGFWEELFFLFEESRKMKKRGILKKKNGRYRFIFGKRIFYFGRREINELRFWKLTTQFIVLLKHKYYCKYWKRSGKNFKLDGRNKSILMDI